MPGTIERIRAEMDVKETAQDKGLRLTIRIDAYDNGILSKDGHPMTGRDPEDSEGETRRWCDLMEVTVMTINEFRDQVMKRRRTRGPGAGENDAA